MQDRATFSSSYHGRGATSFEGSVVDTARARTYHTSPFTSEGSVFNRNLNSGLGGDHMTWPLPPLPPTQSSDRLQWISQQLESWFGTIERFENNLVYISRLVLVDCVTYPFSVFSHQCQLYPYNSVTARITAPFSTLVVLNNIQSVQGMAALWRGWRSHTFQLVALPFLGALLTKLSQLSSGPGGSLLKSCLRTVIVKSLPHLLLIPLTSYTYIDMVQTTKDSDYKEGILQMTRERPLFKQDELRRVPFLVLATPTILHGLLSSAISHLLWRGMGRLFRPPDTSRDALHASKQTPLTSAVGALWMDYLSLLLTDVLLYPLETVLVRLYCQGMPALVDNIQNGLEGSFVSSYYRGVIDCVTGIWDSEGPLGFFKGFSSLLIRYSIHGMVLLLLWRTAQTLETRLHTTTARVE